MHGTASFVLSSVKRVFANVCRSTERDDRDRDSSGTRTCWGSQLAEPSDRSERSLRTDVTRLTVSQWLDQSVNGRNASMATASRQPVFISNAVNGSPVLRFNGAQSLSFNAPVQLT